MKLRIVLLLGAAAIAIASCRSTKIVAMEPSDSAVPQMPIPPKDASATRIAEGKDLFETRCGKCHDLPSPTDFTQTDWEPILKRMQPKARLDDDQMALVREYVFSIAAQ